MKPTPIRVTETAVLDYLQRVEGIDLSKIRARIQRIAKVAETHDGCSAVTKDGFRFVLYGRQVVAVRKIHKAKECPAKDDAGGE